MSHNLTSEQEIALIRDRHISLTANAGSGKTTVLVNKFIDILLNYPPVYNDSRRILAITFTRVAAAEMKSRVARKIEELLSAEIKSSNPDKNKIITLKKIRDRIQFANISTIHSFCLSLLRDNVVEAGLAPNFIDLSEFDALRLQDDAIENTFINYQNDPTFIDFLARYEKKNVRNLVKELINSRNKIDFLIGFSQKDNQTIIKELNNLILEYFNGALLQLYSYINSITQTGNYENLIPAKKDLTKIHIQYISSIISEFLQKFELDYDTLQTIFNRLSIVERGLSRKKLINYFAELLEDKSISKFYEQIKIDKIDDPVKLNCLIDDLKQLIKITLSVIDEYKSLKDQISAVDFNDMIFLTSKLLENKEIARKIRNEFEYILVDEFQDTNFQQFSIIGNLSFDEDTPIEAHKKIFIVGDPKQSIYSFQGAEVEVFNHATEILASYNQKLIDNKLLTDSTYIPTSIDVNSETRNLNLNTTQALGNLSLTTSFRMSPAIAAFVNFIFSRLMQPYNFRFINHKIHYEPIVCGRETIKFLYEPNPPETSKPIGSVSFIFSVKPFENIPKEIFDKPKLKSSNLNNGNENNIELSSDSHEKLVYTFDDIEEDIRTNYRPEETLVAMHIKNIVSGNLDYKIYDSETKQFKTPTYSDIAILTRKKSSFRKIVRVLIENKIPYVISSGIGFFETQEIQDIKEFLNFLVDENDDFAFASVLKSPFFGFTSADLFEIAAFETIDNDNNKSLFKKFESLIKTIDKNSPKHKKYIEAYEIIKSLQFYSSRISIASLISRIVNLDGYNIYMANTPAGEQIKSNFDKLIEYARQFESRGFQTLFDFVEELQQLSENSKEPEALTHTSENAVKIMTIHGAKGAEFPIVYLFDTNYRIKANYRFIFDIDYGLSMKYKEFINGEPVETSFQFHKILQKKIKEKVLTEEIRLFYVAATRAKDHLIISSTLTKKLEGGFKQLNGFIQFLFEVLELEYYEKNFDFTSSFPHYIKEKLKLFPDGSTFDVYVVLNIFDTPTKFPETKEVPVIQKSSINYKIAVEPIFSEMKNKYFYPSSLQDFIEDKDRYIIKKIFNYNDEIIDISDYLERDNSSLFGNAFHEMMQNVLIFIDNNNQINTAKLNELSKKISIKYLKTDTNSDFLSQLVIETLNSKFIQENFNHFLNARREYHLVMPFGEHFLGGIIDCLVQKNANEVEIWDWKTNIISSKNDLTYFHKAYELQMKIYAYIVFQLFKNIKTLNCRLFMVRSNSKKNEEDWIITYEYTRFDDYKKIDFEINSLIQQIENVQY